MSSPPDARHLDRLALVSRLLLDQRVLELRRENEALRLQLFWKDHGRNQLAQLMIQANRAVPGCTCIACSVSGRIDDGETVSFTRQCAFKPWFEARLAASGLNTHAVGLPASPTRTVLAAAAGRHDTTQLYDGADAHFHHVDGRDDWADSWTYGVRLWGARDARDAELLKLERLFGLLREEIEDAGDGIGSSGDETWM
jgi:hypothetical protein